MGELQTAEAGFLSRFDKRVNEAMSVVEAAMKAPDLPRDEFGHILPARPAGMSEREYSIACDANKSSRNAPVYLMEAFDLQKVAMKIAAGLGDNGAPKLVNHIVHVVEGRKYERVRVGKAIDVEATVVEESIEI